MKKVESLLIGTCVLSFIACVVVIGALHGNVASATLWLVLGIFAGVSLVSFIGLMMVQPSGKRNEGE